MIQPPVSTDDRLVRYLLGESSDAERRAVEEEYFSGGETFQALLAAEDALVEEYVRGEMSPERRSRFESHVLASHEGREKARLARSLIEVARKRTAARAPRSGARWFPLRVAALAASLFLAVFVASKIGFHRAEIDPHRLKPPSASAPPPAPTAGGSPAAPVQSPGQRGPEVVSLDVVPGMMRAGEPVPSLQLKPGTQRVRIHAYLDVRRPPLEEYGAILATLDRRQVARRDGLRAISSDAGLLLVIELPAAGVPPGDYLLTVFRVHPGAADEPVSDYRLRIVEVAQR